MTTKSGGDAPRETTVDATGAESTETTNTFDTEADSGAGSDSGAGTEEAIEPVEKVDPTQPDEWGQVYNPKK